MDSRGSMHPAVSFTSVTFYSSVAVSDINLRLTSAVILHTLLSHMLDNAIMGKGGKHTWFHPHSRTQTHYRNYYKIIDQVKRRGAVAART